MQDAGGLSRMVDCPGWWIVQDGGLSRMVDCPGWWIVQDGGELCRMVVNCAGFWWIVQDAGGLCRMVDY